MAYARRKCSENKYPDLLSKKSARKLLEKSREILSAWVHFMAKWNLNVVFLIVITLSYQGRKTPDKKYSQPIMKILEIQYLFCSFLFERISWIGTIIMPACFFEISQ